ncbi:MAG: hypothetical protein CL661_03125 [Bacteroidetes bacterium]|jgi:hypothetical protein|nr:hypothetical protein [Bacteroidota bacterium]
MLRNKFLFIVIIVLLVFAAVIWYLYNNFGKVDGNPWDMIPDNAGLIIEIDKPSDIYNKLENNPIWQRLLEVQDIENFNGEISWIDSLISNKTDYSKLFWNSPLIFTFYSDSITNAEILILSKIESHVDLSKLKSLLSIELGREYAILDIVGVSDGFKIVSVSKNTTRYFTFVDGVFAYSSSADLFKKLYDTYSGKLPKLTDDRAFVKLKQSAGAKVQARVYIQYSELSDILEPILNADNQDAAKLISSFANWSEMDILLKDNELILSGFSIAETEDKYLRKLEGQQSVKLKALNIIPYNANTVVWLGIPDFSKYFYKNNLESTSETISSNLNFDINKLINQIGDEIVFASSANSLLSFTTNSWLIVKMLDNKSAIENLKRIVLNTGNTKTTRHNNYEINKINKTSFIPDVFGDAFSVIENNYYTFIGDYAVFANSESALKSLISYFETGKTLDLNDNFKTFSDNISSQSNLLVYIEPGELRGRLAEYFNNNVVKEIAINEKVINSFQGLAFEFSTGDPLLFTNFYIKYSKEHHEEDLALWKVQLDDDIVWGPYLVSDHQTNNQNIIVFDKRRSMYLINSSGQILWKKKLDNIPISNIFQIDYYKNGKIQYLFNTPDYIYLIDKLGRNVTGFPKKLHSKATNGVVVFDYLNNRDYRLLIAQSDKRVYNYSIKGKEIKGWKLPHTQNLVIEPVTRLVANKKDYIIISDIDNEIKIVNRKGNNRINLSGILKKAKNSDYYVNQTNSKGIILTTDEMGRLVYISSKGKLDHTDFGKFSPDHFFIYKDFNGDNSKDFIFIDGNDLKVFDRFKNELFSYHFESEITIKPSFFNLGKRQRVLGVVADKERTIYLFDNKGNIIISKGLVGETPFTVGNLENDNKINLVSAAGSILYNYRLK